MMEWWNHLSTLNQVFYTAAAVFSVLLIWQFLASLMGLSADHDLGGHDVQIGHDISHDVSHEVSHDVGHDAHAGAGTHVIDGEVMPAGGPDAAHQAGRDAETTVAFKLLTFRSILAFCTLFSWSMALYLTEGAGPGTAMGLALAWGLVAMLAVAALFYAIRRFTETGTQRLDSCVGSNGVVYLDIPQDGFGQVRVTVSGTVSIVRARGAGGQAIKAGTAVCVVWAMDQTTVEVQPLPLL